MHHQHSPQGTGGYGHSVGTESGGGTAGSQQTQVDGRQDRPPGGGTQVGQGMQTTGGPTQAPGGGTEMTPGGGTQTAPQQAPGLALDDALTSQMRVALHDTIKSGRVCEWCADQCIDEGPGMARCIRLCRDVADLAQVNAAFISRDSIFGPDVARTFAEAAEECALECQQHPHEHCQECARVLRRAARTTRELAATTGGRGTVGQEVAGQLPAGQQ